jgi:NAD(P) transhydrogenase subunit alpha
MPSDLELGLYVFMLATFVGLEVIRKVLGFIAITAAVTNIVSGYLITDRMLKMFKKRPSAPAAEERK